MALEFSKVAVFLMGRSLTRNLLNHMDDMDAIFSATVHNPYQMVRMDRLRILSLLKDFERHARLSLREVLRLNQTSGLQEQQKIQEQSLFQLVKWLEQRSLPIGVKNVMIENPQKWSYIVYWPMKEVHFDKNEFTNLVHNFACSGLMDYDESLLKFRKSDEPNFLTAQKQRLNRYKLNKATLWDKLYDRIGSRAQTLISKINRELMEHSSFVDDLKHWLPEDEPFLSAASEQTVYAFLTRLFLVQTIIVTRKTISDKLDLSKLNQLTRRKDGASDAWTVDAVIGALMERIRANVFMIHAERRRQRDWKLSKLFEEMDAGNYISEILPEDVLDPQPWLSEKLFVNELAMSSSGGASSNRKAGIAKFAFTLESADAIISAVNSFADNFSEYNNIDYSPIDEHTLDTEMPADDNNESSNHFLVVLYRLILQSLRKVKNFGLLRLANDIGEDEETLLLVEHDHVKRHVRKMMVWMVNVVRTTSETFEQLLAHTNGGKEKVRYILSAQQRMLFFTFGNQLILNFFPAYALNMCLGVVKNDASAPTSSTKEQSLIEAILSELLSTDDKRIIYSEYLKNFDISLRSEVRILYHWLSQSCGITNIEPMLSLADISLAIDKYINVYPSKGELIDEEAIRFDETVLLRSRLNGAEIAKAIDVTLYQPGDEDIVLKLAKWFNEIHNAETPSPSFATASELLDESLKRKLHTLFYLPVKTLFADIIFGVSTDSVDEDWKIRLRSNGLISSEALKQYALSLKFSSYHENKHAIIEALIYAFNYFKLSLQMIEICTNTDDKDNGKIDGGAENQALLVKNVEESSVINELFGKMKARIAGRMEMFKQEIVRGLWMRIPNKQARFHFIRTIFDQTPSSLVKGAISEEACEQARTILYNKAMMNEHGQSLPSPFPSH